MNIKLKRSQLKKLEEWDSECKRKYKAVLKEKRIVQKSCRIKIELGNLQGEKIGLETCK